MVSNEKLFLSLMAVSFINDPRHTKTDLNIFVLKGSLAGISLTKRSFGMKPIIKYPVVFKGYMLQSVSLKGRMAGVMPAKPSFGMTTCFYVTWLT